MRDLLILLFSVLALTGPAHAADIALLPHVPDNATLSATKSTAYDYLVRDDVSIGFGAPPLTFKSLTGTCVANGLVNDGGSCRNAVGGGSWLAVFPASNIDARWFGACNGVTDDSAALSAADAVVAKTGRIGIFAGCRVSNNIALSHPLYFAGQGQLTVDPGKTLTLNGGFVADTTSPFSGAGTVSVPGSGTPSLESNAIRILNPNGNDGAGGNLSGNAPVWFRPILGNIAGTYHSVGLAVTPGINGLTDNTLYPAAINAAWGGNGVPVPAGTKGKLSALEGNITTAQAPADVDFGDTHIFGGTCISSNGMGCSGMALVVQSTGVTPGQPTRILNAGLTCAVAGNCVANTAGVQIDNQGGNKLGTTFLTDSNWQMNFAAQSQSASGENDSFPGFIGVGDSSQTNPFGAFGNTGAGTLVLGSVSNHPVELRVNNTRMGKWDSTGFFVGADDTHGIKLAVTGIISRLDASGAINLTPGSGGATQFSNVPATPTGKRFLCIDNSTGQIFIATAGNAC